MAGSKTYVVYYIDIKDSESKEKGGGIKFAWRAPSDTYPDNIAKKLGVNKAEDKTSGLIFGMNSPRPIRIRVNYSGKQGQGYFILYVDILWYSQRKFCLKHLLVCLK